MVEGGKGSIDTVRNALKNNTPCVIINGSGRGADVVAYAVKMKEKYPKDDEKKKVRSLIKKKAESDLKLKNSTDQLEECVDWLIECLKTLNKIRIFEFNEDDADYAGKQHFNCIHCL